MMRAKLEETVSLSLFCRVRLKLKAKSGCNNSIQQLI